VVRRELAGRFGRQADERPGGRMVTSRLRAGVTILLRTGFT
jgi:hypothetical protein